MPSAIRKISIQHMVEQGDLGDVEKTLIAARLAAIESRTNNYFQYYRFKKPVLGPDPLGLVEVRGLVTIISTSFGQA